MEILSDRLRELRKAANITQTQLGEVLGSNKFQISSFENGREPSLKMLLKIADYFHVTVDYLLGRTSVPTGDAGDIQMEKQLGLSHDAIDTLRANKDDANVKAALNFFFGGSEIFWAFVDTINDYYDLYVRLGKTHHDYTTRWIEQEEDGDEVDDSASQDKMKGKIIFEDRHLADIDLDDLRYIYNSKISSYAVGLMEEYLYAKNEED